MGLLDGAKGFAKRLLGLSTETSVAPVKPEERDEDGYTHEDRRRLGKIVRENRTTIDNINAKRIAKGLPPLTYEQGADIAAANIIRGGMGGTYYDKEENREPFAKSLLKIQEETEGEKPRGGIQPPVPRIEGGSSSDPETPAASSGHEGGIEY